MDLPNPLQLRCLIIDDKDGRWIRQCVEAVFGKEDGLVEVSSKLALPDADPRQVLPYDVVIVDVMFDNEAQGHFFALHSHSVPGRGLIVVKSAHEIPDGAKLKKYWCADFIDATSRTGRPWHESVTDGLRTWCAGKGLGTRRSPQFEAIVVRPTLDPAGVLALHRVWREYHTAQALTSERRITAHTALVGLASWVLLPALGLKNPPKLPYLLIDEPWGSRLPWELVAFGGLPWGLRTPIVRLKDGVACDRRDGPLKTFAFVRDLPEDEVALEWCAMSDALKAKARPAEPLKSLTLEEFVRDGLESTDVIHVSMHGSEADPTRFSQLKLVLQAAVSANARVLVLCGCETLGDIHSPEWAYSKPLEEFAARIEAIVVSQALLPSAAAPNVIPMWVSSFYAHLATFHEIGMAGAWARDKLANGSFAMWETAMTILVNRDSDLICIPKRDRQ